MVGSLNPPSCDSCEAVIGGNAEEVHRARQVRKVLLEAELDTLHVCALRVLILLVGAGALAGRPER